MLTQPKYGIGDKLYPVGTRSEVIIVSIHSHYEGEWAYAAFYEVGGRVSGGVFGESQLSRECGTPEPKFKAGDNVMVRFLAVPSVVERVLCYDNTRSDWVYRVSRQHCETIVYESDLYLIED